MSLSLAALQERFMGAVLDGSPWPDAGDPPDALDFYRASVRANLRAALASAYPVTERLVGAAFFGEAARLYAARYPSTSGDLHRFGERFAHFLEGHGPARALPYLPDIARLEWAVHESFHSADAAAIDFAGLARVREEERGGLRVRLAPSVRTVWSPHPVHAIWEANQPGRDGTPARLDGPDRVLARRPGGEVVLECVDAAAWRLLEALAQGQPLARASEALGENEGRLPELLAAWAAGGVIASFDPRESA